MKELSFVVQSPTANTILYLPHLEVIKHSGGLVTAQNENCIKADASWPRKKYSLIEPFTWGKTCLSVHSAQEQIAR